MQQPNLDASEIPAAPRDDRLVERKRQIRALKRVLTAKAEVRRIKSLLARKRVGTR